MALWHKHEMKVMSEMAKPCVNYEEQVHHFPIWSGGDFHSLYCKLKLVKDRCHICQNIFENSPTDTTEVSLDEKLY